MRKEKRHKKVLRSFCLLLCSAVLYGVMGKVPIAMAEPLETTDTSNRHPLVDAVPIERNYLLQFEDEEILSWAGEAYDLIMQAARELPDLDREQVQECLDLAHELQQKLSAEQRAALFDERTELSDVIAAMEDMLEVLDAKESGALDTLPQTGKENSWRYLNGEKLEDNPQSLANDIVAFSAGGYWGIDVSHHQGVIDWQSVKQAGIDFAIIRCGYGSDIVSQDDTQWARNASECERLGIPYGVYLYSYATSVEMAESEAQHALRLLNGYTPSLPIFYDLEENRAAVTGVEMLGNMAQAFCDILQKNGYQVGIYANLNWWTHYLTAAAFQNDSWFRWVAEWRAACSYGGRYEMWQYTNSGRLPGIAVNTDMNYWYGSSLSVQSVLQKEKIYSSVYNYQYYVSKYSDLSGMDRMQAIDHFVNQGMKEGRQAIETFNPQIYKQNYQDLQNAYQNDIVQYYYHYMYAGKAEGREARVLLDPNGITVYNGLDYSPVYNFTYYIEHNPDVYDYFQGDAYQILAHFANQGMKEGRQGSEEFDPYLYRQNYPDLQAAYGGAIWQYYFHYLYTGKNEGRTGNKKVQREPITIYNGLDYAPVYDFTFYSNNNPDVTQYYNGDDYAILAHFVLYGMNEARRGNAEFDVQIYKNNYADLREAYADELVPYYLHYIYAGKKEGRIANVLLQ